MFYWFMKYVVVGPIVRAVFRPWVVGSEHIPAHGAAILASNHLSVSDSIFLPLMIDRPVSFLAKSDYFTGRGLKGWATRNFMKLTGQIPIDRSGGKASEASLNTGLMVLDRGDLPRLAARVREEIDESIAASEENQEVVTALEQQHDADLANWSNELPSGDELMDQIEQFLAGREDTE